MKLTPYVASLWLLAGLGVGASESHELANPLPLGSLISVINMGLITIGGTCAILYQRRLDAEAKRREMIRREHAKDLAAGLATDLATQNERVNSESISVRDRIADLRARLDGVLAERDRFASQNELLLGRYLDLVDRVGVTAHPTKRDHLRMIGDGSETKPGGNTS